MADDVDWSLGTWEGARRERIRRNLLLTLDERLELIEELRDVNDWLGTVSVRPRPFRPE